MRTALVLFCLVTRCVVSAADGKPDFSVTGEEFAKEYNADRSAFEKKYVGKTVEVSGTVRATAVPRSSVVLEGAKKKPTDPVGTGVACQLSLKLDAQLRALAKGQQITVRGKCVRGTTLSDCEFVKVGPSTALPVTLSALAAEFKKDRATAVKAYRDKAVVVKVAVLGGKKDGFGMTWTVTEPDDKDGPKVHASASSSFDQKFMAELEKVKAGDTLLLLAYVGVEESPFRLWNATVLKDPPEGVKLPGDKK